MSTYSDIQICNLALSHLGDIATVTNIASPSTQQEKWCATFYPMARDIVLSDRAWSFNTVRLALVTSSVTPPSTWLYAYDVPSNAINFLGVIDANALDDYTSPVNYVTLGLQTAPIANLGIPTSYPFVIEWNEAGTKQVLYTSLASAVGRYTISITDTTKYTMPVVDALAYLLASYLAGPLIKGEEGRKLSSDMRKFYEQIALPKAAADDAESRNLQVNSGAPWIVGRG